MLLLHTGKLQCKAGKVPVAVKGLGLARDNTGRNGLGIEYCFYSCLHRCLEIVTGPGHPEGVFLPIKEGRRQGSGIHLEGYLLIQGRICLRSHQDIVQIELCSFQRGFF